MSKRPLPKIQYAIALPLALSLILFSGCQQQGGFTPPPAAVETAPVVARPWTITFQTTGTVEANNKVDLNTETPGIISQILVQEGDRVGRGQVLMRLKADKAYAQVQQSAAGVEVSKNTIELEKAQIQQVQANVNAAEVRRDNARMEYQRFQKLFAQQFISELELDQRRLVYETAEADYQAAQEQLSGARARRAQAEANLTQARSGHRYSQALAGENVIRAPFSGIVGQKYVDQGDFVAPTEKLVTVVDPSLYRIQFNVPERYLGDVRKGLPVEVGFDGFDHIRFAATVDFVDPVVDLENRTVAVKAVVADPMKKLRHGLFGTVKLTLRTIDGAIVIPEEAVVPQGDKTLVYVAKGGKAHLREIVVGHRDAGYVKVDSGLRSGERVITSGLQKVHDGSEVVDAATAQGGMQGKASAPLKTKVVHKTEKSE